MADQGKTEKPTGKRREKARKDGQVARSTEVNSVIVLLATFGVLALTGPRLLARAEAIVSSGLSRSGNPSLATSAGRQDITGWAFSSFTGIAAPVMIAAALGGILASVAQVGFRLNGRALKPSLSKLNLIKGLKRLFAPSQAFELGKTLVKTAIIGGVAFSAVWSQLPTMGALVGMPPAQLVSVLAHTILSIVLRVGAAMLLVAAADYAWQRHKHEKSLKMTREQVRREAKEADVAPEMKGQMRRRQSEMARRRMLADVPTADVVIVNPTHYAVALRYDGTRPAPELVAKGVDNVALAIRRTAEEAGVAIVHEAPLARALYRDVELGAQIPEELFAAVAHVLAFVLRAAGRLRAVTQAA
ncbi:MAG TPA: flagellar biosynthesis protein FlhB [Gaiellales bacterium]|nr:flagellar biosynthesis protein FlhB [Gaiellales bacterium]